MKALPVPARIDVDNAVQVLESLREAAAPAASAAPMALDLSALRDFDSSALSLLLQLAREHNVTAERQSLFLVNPPRKLQELADLYGVAAMLFGAHAQAADAAGRN
jgi:anti-anti-sigma factor